MVGSSPDESPTTMRLTLLTWFAWVYAHHRAGCARLGFPRASGTRAAFPAGGLARRARRPALAIAARPGRTGEDVLPYPLTRPGRRVAAALALATPLGLTALSA